MTDKKMFNKLIVWDSSIKFFLCSVATGLFDFNEINLELPSKLTQQQFLEELLETRLHV